MKHFFGGLLLVLLSSPVQAQGRAIFKNATRNPEAFGDGIELIIGLVVVYGLWNAFLDDKISPIGRLVGTAIMTVITLGFFNYYLPYFFRPGCVVFGVLWIIIGIGAWWEWKFGANPEKPTTDETESPPSNEASD